MIGLEGTILRSSQSTELLSSKLPPFSVTLILVGD